MTASRNDEELAFDCELDAPPDKVFRALTVPAFVERWLKPDAVVEAEVLEATPGQVRWRWREIGEPEGSVVFTLQPTESGGTLLRLIHIHQAVPAMQPAAANRNDITMMLAA